MRPQFRLREGLASRESTQGLPTVDVGEEDESHRRLHIRRQR